MKIRTWTTEDYGFEFCLGRKKKKKKKKNHLASEDVFDMLGIEE